MLIENIGENNWSHSLSVRIAHCHCAGPSSILGGTVVSIRAVGVIGCMSALQAEGSEFDPRTVHVVKSFDDCFRQLF